MQAVFFSLKNQGGQTVAILKTVAIYIGDIIIWLVVIRLSIRRNQELNLQFITFFDVMIKCCISYQINV